MKTTKILAVNVVVLIPIMALVYITVMNTGTSDNIDDKDKAIQCHNDGSNNQIHVKMFDSQIAPKYIVGKDYNIIPVNPATTDAIVNGCTLAARPISQ
jgi:hypothetical protein